MRYALTALVMLTTTQMTSAEVPQVVGFQGQITDNAGIPVPDGSYAVTFAIYPMATGGTSTWSEVNTVATTDGLFVVHLGQSNPIPDSALADTATYLEMTIAPDPPLSPRTRLTSAPYARVSSSVQGIGPVALRAYEVSTGDSAYLIMGPQQSASGEVEHIELLCGYSDNLLSQTASIETLVSPDSGVVETTTTEAASGRATGKRQHRPFTIVKSSSLTDFADSFGWDFSLRMDSGYRETARMNKADLISEITQGTSQTREHILLARQVGVPAAADQHALELQVDSSGPSLHLDRVVGNDSAKATLTALGTSLDSKFDTVASEIKTTAAESGAAVSLKSEVGAHVTGVDMSTGNRRGTVRPYDLSASGMFRDAELGADSTGGELLLRASDRSDTSTGQFLVDTEILSLSLTDPSPTSPASQQRNLFLFVTPTLVSTSLNREGLSDSSAIEMLVSDTLDQIALTTTTAGAKWPSLTLKRGITGSSVSVSHVGAGANDGVFVSSDAAAGGALGINTSAPVLPFQLVGSGCYTGTFGLCSDQRFKDNVRTLHDPLGTLQALRGVEYTWKRADYPDHQFPEGEQIGLIAQEVEQILPGIVATDAEGFKSVDYARLSALLVEAVKEQQQQIASQQRQIDELKELITRWTNQSDPRADRSYGSR